MVPAINWSNLPEYAAAVVFGYLCGSIPFGVLLTRLAGVPDVRTIGSGNIGAINVLRTGRKALAAATLVGDMLKGAVPVLVVHHFFGAPAAILAAIGAFLGHLFPVWLGFKGGKGVATFIGLLVVLSYGSLCWPFASSGSASRSQRAIHPLPASSPALQCPPSSWWDQGASLALLFLMLTAALWITHRANIARLIGGTESKIGGGASA